MSARAIYDFASGLRFSDLSAEVQHQARRCLLDLLGVAAAGRRTDLSRIIHDHAAMQFGGTQARLLFDGRQVSAAGAALAGGMTIDSVDAHDGHPLNKGHAGCGVLPALLAMVEAEGLKLSGEEFLTALVIGYEVSIRAGIALHDTACDYHTSGAWVAVGITAMAIPLLGLSYEQWREAAGIAEYHGPRSQMMRAIDAPTMVKDGSGWGAMAGVSAAYLGKAGFTGSPAITLEAADVASWYVDLGATWRIMEMYFKPFPVCRWAQPPVQAMQDVMAEKGFALGDVAAIEVQTFHEAVRLAVGIPTSTEEAQYNLPFSVAAYLVFGQLGPEEISREGFEHPEVQRVMGLISMSEDAAFNDAFPATRWARVKVTLNDGSTHFSEPSVGIGNAENPLSDDFLARKFDQYCAYGGVTEAQSLRDALWQIDGLADFSDLMDRLFVPVKHS